MSHLSAAADARNRQGTTVVGADASIVGDLSSRQDMRIEGSVKGSVNVEAGLEVVAGATVEADVRAQVVRVGGTVRGNIAAVKLVELLASARVHGDITAPALHVVEGAQLQGRVHMERGEAAPSR